MHEGDASWWDYRSVTLSQEEKLKTRNCKDNTFLQIFVKNKVHRSKILLMRRKEKNGKKGGKRNGMIRGKKKNKLCGQTYPPLFQVQKLSW